MNSLFQPIQMAQINPNEYPQEGRPATMPNEGLPATMPNEGLPAEMPMEGAPAEFPQEGRPAMMPGEPVAMNKYSVGDPMMDKYINMFLGNA